MVSIRHRERSGDLTAHLNQGVDRSAHIDDVLKSTGSRLNAMTGMGRRVLRSRSKIFQNRCKEIPNRRASPSRATLLSSQVQLVAWTQTHEPARLDRYI